MTLSLVMDRLSTRRLVKSGALARPDEGFELGFERGFEQGLRHQLRQAQAMAGEAGGAGPRARGCSGFVENEPAGAMERFGRGAGVGVKKIQSVPRLAGAQGGGLEGGLGEGRGLGEAFFIEERSNCGVSLSLWARAEPVALPGRRGVEIGLRYELRARSDRLAVSYEASEETARAALAAGGSAVCQALYLDPRLAERVGLDFARELSAGPAGVVADPGQEAWREGGAARAPREPAYLPGELEEPEWASGR